MHRTRSERESAPTTSSRVRGRAMATSALSMRSATPGRTVHTVSGAANTRTGGGGGGAGGGGGGGALRHAPSRAIPRVRTDLVHLIRYAPLPGSGRFRRMLAL